MFYPSVKPQPAAPEGMEAVPCWKCNGTGFYCMGTVNGVPYSYTGYVCFPCGGEGWRYRKTRPAKKVLSEAAQRGVEARREKSRAKREAKEAQKAAERAQREEERAP